MKLRLHFGLHEPGREINWWQSIKDFPYLVLFRGKKYEFVMWQEDPLKKVAYICHFSEVQSYDPNWYATTYYDLDPLIGLDGRVKCECGAIYTSFPQLHMFFCPKWERW